MIENRTVFVEPEVLTADFTASVSAELCNSSLTLTPHSPLSAHHPPPQAGAVLCLGAQTSSSERRKSAVHFCLLVLSAICRLAGRPATGDPLTFFTNKDPPHTVAPSPRQA